MSGAKQPIATVLRAGSGECEEGRPYRRPIEKLESVHNGPYYRSRIKLPASDHQRLKKIIADLGVYEGPRFTHALYALAKMIAHGRLAVCVVPNEKQGADTLKMLQQLRTQLVRLDRSFGPLFKPIIQAYTLACSYNTKDTDPK